MSLELTGVRGLGTAGATFDEVRWLDQFTGRIGSFTTVQLIAWLAEDPARLAFVGRGIRAARVELAERDSTSPRLTIRNADGIAPILGLPEF